MTVTLYLGVSNFQRAMSMVIPRSRSALSLSRTHAYLKAVGQHWRGDMQHRESKRDEESVRDEGQRIVANQSEGKSSPPPAVEGVRTKDQYLQDFPSSAASFSNFSMVRLSIPPHCSSARALSTRGWTVPCRSSDRWW
jgi:hypothetical protein